MDAVAPVAGVRTIGHVWVTVPHALCPPEDDGTTHFCDYLAPKGAWLIRDALARAGAQPLLFVGDVPRTECDLNRSACVTAWILDMRRRRPQPAAVVDVHSMPSSASFGADGFDVVLLDDGDAPSPLTVAVARALDEDGISVFTVRGQGNAIIDAFPKVSTLVELSELTLRDPVRLLRAASAVALGVMRSLHVSSSPS